MSIENLVKIFQPKSIGLFEFLSPQSVYRRFFTPMKRLSHSLLARFTQIDYDRHIALFALPEVEPVETMLGVARVIIGRNLKEAEFSVVVSDPCREKESELPCYSAAYRSQKSVGLKPKWEPFYPKIAKCWLLGKN